MRLTTNQKSISKFFMTGILVVLSLLFTSGSTFAQTSCGGTLTVNETQYVYGTNPLIIGDGTGPSGQVQICITSNSLIAACGMGSNNDLFVIQETDGTIVATVNATNGNPCVTIPLANGFAMVSFLNGNNCVGGPSEVTFSWTTIDGGGNDLCVETCDDGIQNQDETGVDCGGTYCVPCSCFNGIQDIGETGVDCGGPCAPCGNCFDGIQNGSETGVDCGGTCGLPCSTNSATPDGGSSNCCSTTTAVNVYPSNCDQIGTSAYNLNSPEVTINSSPVSAGCLPSGTSGCGAYGSEGTWTQYSLANGVNYLQLAPVSVQGFGTGNSITYHAYFQGPDCSNLNYIDCQPAIQFSAGGYYFFESSVTGLDPNQDVWVYTWNDNNKYFDYTIQAVGAAPATNTSCPGSTALGDACNLGAQGASFNTPGSQGVLCSGGNWGSNENTTFYSFTADATTGSLDIQNIICNDGTNGQAQFGVWTSCAAIGTYGSGFLGCAVGTATLSLSPLTPGQTYYIAADGFAGDNCTWSFSGTGILLPIELGDLSAYHTGQEVEVFWTTISEENNDYFTVQRTLDGRTFEDVGVVFGAGTTFETQDYAFTDKHPYDGTSYYRIKQTDYDGKFRYSELVTVHHGKSNATVVRTVNLMGQEVGPDYKGMVIDVLSDGTIVKRMNL